MTRNFKALGLTVVAVLAMGALAVPAASAAVEHTFNVESAPADITGETVESIHVLKFGEAVIECTALYTGTQGEANQDELTLTPELKECKTGASEVTITNEGCKYVLDSDTTENPKTGGEDAPLKIDCGGTGKIKTVAPGCTFTLEDNHSGAPVNQNLHGVKYEVKGEGKTSDLLAEMRVHGLAYVANNNGCALLGISKGTHTAGATTAKVTLRAYKDGSSHEPANQVGFSVTTP